MIKRLSVVLILGAVTLFVTPKTNSKLVSGLALQADGGHPIPPWPGPSNVIQPPVLAQTPSPLLADGGHPIPPWPPSGGVRA